LVQLSALVVVPLAQLITIASLDNAPALSIPLTRLTVLLGLLSPTLLFS